MPYVINGIDKSTIWLFRFFYIIYQNHLITKKH